MELVKCTNLYKSYGNTKISVDVLKNINLIIKEGEFCLITGPSGSGKSTFLYTLSGLEKPTKGSVELFNKSTLLYNFKETSDLRKSKIGFVFQFYNLLPNLNVYENIKLAQVINKTIVDAKIDKYLDIVNMSNFKHLYPNELSGGMRQRVAIARALINDPKIIFADEPTGNLDQKSGFEIMDLFKTLNRDFKKTIIMVTHSEDYLPFASRHIKIVDGEVILDEQTTI